MTQEMTDGQRPFLIAFLFALGLVFALSKYRNDRLPLSLQFLITVPLCSTLISTSILGFAANRFVGGALDPSARGITIHAAGFLGVTVVPVALGLLGRFYKSSPLIGQIVGTMLFGALVYLGAREAWDGLAAAVTIGVTIVFGLMLVFGDKSQHTKSFASSNARVNGGGIFPKNNKPPLDGSARTHSPLTSGASLKSRASAAKVSVSLNVDADVLSHYLARGGDLSDQINSELRRAMIGQKEVR